MTALFKSRTGGRRGVRQLLVGAFVGLCVYLPGAPVAATWATEPSPAVSVWNEGGTFSVAASFEVPESAVVALAVLSDYEQIPRFMPGVRRSVILERTPGRLLIEQEAVSRFMMFSKKVHLVLEVTEDTDTIRFVDRCGRSFVHYEGAWRVTQKEGGATVTYVLAARPAFEVPEFILKRLLKRDSGQMISRLRREIAAHAARSATGREGLQ